MTSEPSVVELEDGKMTISEFVGIAEGPHISESVDSDISEVEDPENLPVQKADWVPYQGPRGGEGWQNTESGEVVYDEEPPGDVSINPEEYHGADVEDLLSAVEAVTGEDMTEEWGDATAEEVREAIQELASPQQLSEVMEELGEDEVEVPDMREMEREEVGDFLESVDWMDISEEKLKEIYYEVEEYSGAKLGFFDEDVPADRYLDDAPVENPEDALSEVEELTDGKLSSRSRNKTVLLDNGQKLTFKEEVYTGFEEPDEYEFSVDGVPVIADEEDWEEIKDRMVGVVEESYEYEALPDEETSVEEAREKVSEVVGASTEGLDEMSGEERTVVVDTLDMIDDEHFERVDELNFRDGMAVAGTFDPDEDVVDVGTSMVSPDYVQEEDRLASDDARHILIHELGHAAHYRNVDIEEAREIKDRVDRGAAPSWGGQAKASQVSSQAWRNPMEFVAEVWTGLHLGKEYDDYVMEMYKELEGPEP